MIPDKTSLRARARSRELMVGTFLNLGSTATAEMAALAGFDWLLIDCEHGLSDFGTLFHQLQATARTQAAPIVRVQWNEAPVIKRILDLGPAGIMVPMVNTAEDARAAARHVSYPPEGVRGVAKMNRACAYGQSFREYFDHGSKDLLLIAQIETPEAVANADSIAAVERVDVLFVGPTDLGVNMGIPDALDDPAFMAALERVSRAALAHGKCAGILAASAEALGKFRPLGYTFMAASADSAMVASGMRSLATSLRAI